MARDEAELLYSKNCTENITANHKLKINRNGGTSTRFQGINETMQTGVISLIFILRLFGLQSAMMNLQSDGKLNSEMLKGADDCLLFMNLRDYQLIGI